jgi:hypothetical protein
LSPVIQIAACMDFYFSSIHGIFGLNCYILPLL